MTRVAVYGGSFDPPHVGHALAAAYALQIGGVERVLAIPVFVHAFGKALLPFEHRLRMTELAMQETPRVVVTDVERTLGEPSRTLKTLEHLVREHPDWECSLVVGADVLDETHAWKQFDEVCRIAPLFVLGRAGVSHPGAPPAVLPEVSSTAIRERLASLTGPATDDAELRRLVPRAVLEYIDAHGLYR